MIEGIFEFQRISKESHPIFIKYNYLLFNSF